MFSFLKDHPFAVEAFFNSSIVLTFAVPKAELKPLIPACLELDTFNDQWAFIAVAMVQTTGLRPKGFHKIFSNRFYLIGYRMFVHYTTNAGKRWRGLYIIKSETDSKKMELLGNMFTRYKYTTTDIRQTSKGNMLQVESHRSDFIVKLDVNANGVELPPNSPFNNWKEARRYAGPLPFTFSYDSGKNRVLIIEGVRQHWTPKPIHVTDYHFSFLERANLSGIQLANAFIINNVPYYWKKGKTEEWKG